MGETERNGSWRSGIGPMEARLFGLMIAGALGANPIVQAMRNEEPRTITLQLDGIRDDLRDVKDGIKEGNRLYNVVNQRVNDVENRVNLLERLSKP